MAWRRAAEAGLVLPVVLGRERVRVIALRKSDVQDFPRLGGAQGTVGFGPPLGVETVVHAVGEPGRVADDRVRALELNDPAEVVDAGGAIEVQVRLDGMLEFFRVPVIGCVPVLGKRRSDELRLELEELLVQALGRLLRRGSRSRGDPAGSRPTSPWQAR